ncbi:hypothetical protein JW859_03395 [bacterium]|nr:hypothetical protein [bacterium]
MILLTGCGGTSANPDISCESQVADETSTAGIADALDSAIDRDWLGAIEDALVSGDTTGAITKLDYRSPDGAGLNVTTREQVAVDTTPAATEIRLAPAGRITDAYLTIAAPADGAGSVSVAWNEELAERFLTIAVMTPEGLELSVAGLRKAAASELAQCQDPKELRSMLADRWTLADELLLCTVRWQAISGSTAVTVPDIRKCASTPGEVDRVGQVDVRVVDGQYEVGWKQQLLADYNQDGEVGQADLTPLGILFGLKQEDFGWLLPCAARVDGDGNGLINASDLTPLGYNYGNRLQGFRVERADGDETGPGEAWETVAQTGRATVTQYNNPVTSTGGEPYQRVTDATASGWRYYRVVALADGGWEAEPSEAALAPDVTTPAWAADPGLARDLELENGYRFTFDETAEDDRGPLDYALQLVGGEGDPDDLFLMMEFNSQTSTYPVTSPYQIIKYGNNYVELYQGEQYYLRLKAIDTGGNSIVGSWYGFIADLEGEDTIVIRNNGDEQLWINQEGTVRFTPPTPYVAWGNSYEAREICYFIKPVSDTEQPSYEDYQSGDWFDYEGGELVWEKMLKRGERLCIAFRATHADDENKMAFGEWSVIFPEIWIKPFEVNQEVFDSFTPSVCCYLPDGSALWRDQLVTSEPVYRYYLLQLAGGTWFLANIEDIPTYTFSNSILQVKTNGDIVFHDSTGGITPGSVTWFRMRQGIVGQAIEPEGEFYSEWGSQNYIMNWEVEDEDTVIGTRNVPVDAGDGVLGFEVWEAKRNGTMGMREMIYPMEVVEDDITQILPVVNGQLAVNVRVLTGITGLGLKLYDEYYAFRNDDDTWLVIDGQVYPTGFDGSEWEDINIYLYNHCEDVCFCRIVGINYGEDNNTDDDELYTGIFAGNLKEGLASFELLYDNDNRRNPEDYPLPFCADRLLFMVEPYNGTARVDNGPYTYVVYPDGTYKQLRFVYEHYENLHLTNGGIYNAEVLKMYWRDYDYIPGIAKMNISDDGQWISPLGEGTWGMAYWIN